MSLRDYETVSIEDFRKEEFSLPYLALLLKRQELALLLGAGVSMLAGLPGWVPLVEGCEREVGIDPPLAGRSAAELMSSIDSVRRRLDQLNDGRKMSDIVRSNLYKSDWLAAGEYPLDILENRMLIAIGALVMASSRGSIGDVFTLNFDDLLEWYLHLHGFRTQVVGNFPTYLRGDVDVTVFHPHGFLPLVERDYSKSGWMVLSHTELVARLAEPSGPWSIILASRFLSKRFLVVGSGMNDIDIDVQVRNALMAHGGKGPIGFVVDVNLTEDKQSAFMELGLVPVVFDDYKEIPDFLLRICQRAALTR